jgi:DNA adenine methylase
MANSEVVPFVPRQSRGVLTPIIKWVGGKRKLVPTLAARMPRSYARYFEPFAGGAALYLHVEPEHAVLADTNADLINVYHQAAERPEAVLTELEKLACRHSEQFYSEVRAHWNSLPTGRRTFAGVWGAAAFLYLNKTCFNGLWRVNADGGFNVPIGDADGSSIVSAPEIRAAAPAFARAELRVCDFREAVAAARGGDFVYFDPPYIPTSATAKFSTYTPGGFGVKDHDALADVARGLVGRGCQVMLSNSDTPLAWELYGAWPGFRIERVSRNGTINADPAKRGRVTELLITAGYQIEENAPR